MIDLKTGLANAGFSLVDELVALYTKDKAKRNGPRYDDPPMDRDFIERQAEAADVAIFTIGRQAGEGGDRRIDGDFNLADAERALLQNVCFAFRARGKKTVVILNMGNGIETASWKALPDAILLAWQPGQEGGNSVADILSGKVSPSGKLTMTFPATIADHPAYLNFPTGPGSKFGDKKRNVDYTIHEEGIYVGYRYFTTFGREVSYPFGYGLSYTTFAYSEPKVKAAKDGFKASVTVTNTGKVAGKEVVQLYVKAPKGAFADKPARELKAFAKTRTLQPGEKQTLTFDVDAYSLASFSKHSSRWETAPGKYAVLFAASSEDVRERATFNQPKEMVWPVHDVMAPTRNFSDKEKENQK